MENTHELFLFFFCYFGTMRFVAILTLRYSLNYNIEFTVDILFVEREKLLL